MSKKLLVKMLDKFEFSLLIDKIFPVLLKVQFSMVRFFEGCSFRMVSVIFSKVDEFIEKLAAFRSKIEVKLFP